MDQAKWIGAQGGPGDLQSTVPGHLFQEPGPLCCFQGNASPLKPPLLGSATGWGTAAWECHLSCVEWMLDRPSQSSTTRKRSVRPEAAYAATKQWASGEESQGLSVFPELAPAPREPNSVVHLPAEERVLGWED